MRGWLRRRFPGEFSWRLFVVVQWIALLGFVYFLIAETDDGRPPFKIRYETVYEQVDVDSAAIEAARERCSHLSDDPNAPPDPQYSPTIRLLAEGVLSPREMCFLAERPDSLHPVGRELAGIARINGLLLLGLVAALLAPFTIIRVTLWVVAGLRSR